MSYMDSAQASFHLPTRVSLSATVFIILVIFNDMKSIILLIILIGFGLGVNQAFGFLSIQEPAPRPEIPLGEIKIGTWINYQTGTMETSPIIEIDMNNQDEYYVGGYNTACVNANGQYYEHCRNDVRNIIYTIPTWVLNIPEWYQQGLITLEEARNAQRYIIKEGIAELKLRE